MGNQQGFEAVPQFAQHQQQFVYSVLREEPPKRYVLVSPPGYGKSTAIAELVRTLVTRDPSSRVLIVSPVLALVQQWKDLLDQRSVQSHKVDPPGYRRLELESTAGDNPWAPPGCYLTTFQFLSSGQRSMEVGECPWDLVVFDELHVAAGSLSLLRKIWQDRKVRYVVGSTATEPDWIEEVREDTIFVRWSRDEVARWAEGRIPARNIERHLIEVTAAEQEFAKRVLRRITARAKQDPRVRLAAMIVMQRLASSLFAAEQSLRRMAADSPAEWVPELEDADELSSPDPQTEVLESKTQLLTQTELIELLDYFDDVERDSKFLYCEHLLTDTMPTRSERQVVLFSDFSDTVHYLNAALKERGWETVVLTGSTASDRGSTLQKAMGMPGAVIITTAAATEGLSLAFTDSAIHYDLPSNPFRLAQRFGRIDRISNPNDVITHHLLIDKVTESTVWADRLLRLTEKAEQLRAATGGEWQDWWQAHVESE